MEEENVLAGLLDSLDLDTVLSGEQHHEENNDRPIFNPSRMKSPGGRKTPPPFSDFLADIEAELPKSKTAPPMQLPDYLLESLPSNWAGSGELPMMTTAPANQPFLPSQTSLNTMRILGSHLQASATAYNEKSDLDDFAIHSGLLRQASAPATLVAGHLATGRVTVTEPDLSSGNEEFETKLLAQMAQGAGAAGVAQPPAAPPATPPAAPVAPAHAAPPVAPRPSAPPAPASVAPPPGTPPPAALPPTVPNKRKGGSTSPKANRRTPPPPSTPPPPTTPPAVTIPAHALPPMPPVAPPGVPTPLNVFSHLSHLNLNLLDQNQLLAMAMASGISVGQPPNKTMKMPNGQPPTTGAYLISTPTDLNEEDEAAAKKKRARKRRKNKKRDEKAYWDSRPLPEQCVIVPV